MIYYIKKIYLVFLFVLFLVQPFSNGLWAENLQTPENNTNNSISNQTQGSVATPSQSTLSGTTTTVNPQPSDSTRDITNTPSEPKTVIPNTNNKVVPNSSSNKSTVPSSNSTSTTMPNSNTAPNTSSGDITNNVVLPGQKLDSPSNTTNEEKVSVFDSPSTIYKKVVLSGATIFIQPVLDDIKGVIDSRVVYVGGVNENPTHNNIMSNKAPGYVEAVQLLYDPLAVNFIDIIDIYTKKTIQPSRTDGQFCYKGNMYAPKIFYYDTTEQTQLDEYFKKLATDYPNLTSKVTYTKIEGLKVWPAEEEYQKYYENNNIRYNYYYQSCSVDDILKQTWNMQSTDSTNTNKSGSPSSSVTTNNKNINSNSNNNNTTAPASNSK